MPLLNHIGVSGGKDSTALLLWAVHESGYDPASLRATFCDTGNESPVTLRFIQLLSERALPIETLRPSAPFFDLALQKGLFPSKRARFCTFELKIKPSREWINARAKEGCQIRVHTGVRRDESLARSELEEWDFDGETLCELRRPLVAWGIEEVLAIHRRHGIPLNPLYGQGSSRVGCYPCVMSRKREIAAAAEYYPEVIERIEAAEDAMAARHSGRSAHFFPKNMVPKQYRKKTVVGKDGRPHQVAGIRDVVEWAGTEWGGKQSAMFPSHQFDAGLSCSATMGWCE